MAMRYNRLLRGARSVEQIVAKLDPSRADILLSQLRPAILQPAYILIRDRVERRLFFVIRGTHSVRDTVTSLTAHPRPLTWCAMRYALCPAHTRRAVVRVLASDINRI